MTTMPVNYYNRYDAAKEYDKHFEAYRNRTENLDVYVKYLMSVGGGNKSCANLRLLLEALSWEERLDFNRVETERRQLVERMARDLSQQTLQDLVRRSMQYRLGQVAYGDYYRYLRRLCKENGINLDGYSELNTYINYVLLAEQINRTIC